MVTETPIQQDPLSMQLPSRMADWTTEQRAWAARSGWRTRRWRAQPEYQIRARLDALLTAGDPRTLRLLACDLAEGVLHHFTDHYPGDLRLAVCLQIARRYAEGQATEYERLAAYRLMVVVCNELPGWRDPAYPAANATGFCLSKSAGHGLEWAAYYAATAEGRDGHRIEHTQQVIAAIEAREAEQRAG